MVWLWLVGLSVKVGVGIALVLLFSNRISVYLKSINISWSNKVYGIIDIDAIKSRMKRVSDGKIGNLESSFLSLAIQNMFITKKG